MAYVNSMPLAARSALAKLSRDLRDARLRRRLSMEDMAGRMFVSRHTVWRMEKGDASIGFGIIATALFILGLDDRLANLADQTEDIVGLDLDRERLPKRIRKRKSAI